MWKHLHYGFHLVLCLGLEVLWTVTGLPVLHIKLKAEAQPRKRVRIHQSTHCKGELEKKMALWE